ncbi:MAG: hypothetical protein ACI9MJ_001974, partial [Alphaproteobacteria bacterium]
SLGLIVYEYRERLISGMRCAFGRSFRKEFGRERRYI